MSFTFISKSLKIKNLEKLCTFITKKGNWTNLTKCAYKLDNGCYKHFFTKKEIWTNLTKCAYKLDNGCYKHSFTKKEIWTNLTKCAYKLDNGCYKHIFHKKGNLDKSDKMCL